MNSFKRWDDYQTFSRAVRHSQRYIRTSETDAFLAAVRSTAIKRVQNAKRGFQIWRAQRGSCERVAEEKGGIVEELAFSPNRMMPRTFGREGRANPKGVSFFYGATTPETAMSEVRPWPGEDISLALFKLAADIQIVDCSKFHASDPMKFFWAAVIDQKVFSPDQIEEAVWIHIDRAFSQPVTESDEAPQYVPTQILAELFRSEGYGGIAYKSSLTDEGFNLALFDSHQVEQVLGRLYRTERVRYEFSKEPFDEYYVENGGAVRMVIADVRPVDRKSEKPPGQ